MTSGNAVEPGADTLEPGPYRIGFTRRLRMWRLGRQDGRHGVPDPLSEPPPLTTRVRKDLESDFIDAALGVWVQHLHSTENLRRGIRTLDSQLPDLEAAVTAAAKELELTRTNRPDPATPRRRASEDDHPIELIRDRRDREHERAVAKSRRQCDAAEVAVAEARRQRNALAAELAGPQLRDKTRVDRLHATFQRTRAIYDHALLGRHPLHELVRPDLDATVPPVPDPPPDPIDESGR